MELNSYSPIMLKIPYQARHVGARAGYIIIPPPPPLKQNPGWSFDFNRYCVYIPFQRPRRYRPSNHQDLPTSELTNNGTETEVGNNKEECSLPQRIRAHVKFLSSGKS